MLREEKTYSVAGGGLLLIAAFLVIFSPLQLGELELYWQEGYYAAQALEMPHGFPISIVHGEAIGNSFPLYPLLISIVYKLTGLPLEFVLRGLSALSVAVITMIVWRAARSAGGLTAAFPAAAVMISTNIVMDKAVEGYPQTLMMIFLLAGWLVWFDLGFNRRQWDMAWIFSMFFGGLAFYSGGFQALIYYFVPFIFLRRPLNIWRKMNSAGFWCGLFIVVCFIVLWGVPYILLADKLPFTSLPMTGYFNRYTTHLIEFPLDIVLRLMPWSLIAWAPFCVALFPLDSKPIYSRFLRTIIISLLFVIWLNPLAEPRDMMILLPPLSILTGMNYWIMTRRYGDRLIKLMIIPAWLLIIPAMVIAAFYFIPAEWGMDQLRLEYGYDFRDLFQYRIAGTAASVLMILISWFLVMDGLQRPLWVWLLLLTSCFALFNWGVKTPYRAQDSDKRNLGIEMRRVLRQESVPDNEIIYKSGILDFYNECIYLGGPVRKITALNELPQKQQVVYLISTEFPQVPERRWRNLLPERLEYRGRRLCLYQGTLTEGQTGDTP